MLTTSEAIARESDLLYVRSIWKAYAYTCDYTQPTLLPRQNSLSIKLMKHTSI